MIISVTPLGVFFVAALAFAVFRPRALPWVLSASLAFPQSAMVIVGLEMGITPFHATAAVCAGRLMLMLYLGQRPARLTPGVTICLLVLAGYAGLITALGPFLSEGLRVLDPGSGIDDEVVRGTPLVYSLGNVAQYGYLLLGICALAYLATERTLSRALLLPGLVLGIGLSTLRLLLETVGMAWPVELFDTMPGYGYAIYDPRLRGVFSEASVMGAFAVAALAVFLAQYLETDRSRRWLRGWLLLGAAASAGCLLSARSATGILAVVVLAAVIGGRRVLRQDRSRSRYVAYWVLGGVTGAVVVAWRGIEVVAALPNVVVSKLATDSFANRFASDGAGLEILWRSWGLGVGLGSSRSSSLATTLLSCVGVIGFLAFAVLAVLALRSGFGHRTTRPLAWGLAGLLVGHLIAQPDISSGILWVLLALCLAGGRGHDEVPTESLDARLDDEPVERRQLRAVPADVVSVGRP
jgi:hypothetical protein